MDDIITQKIKTPKNTGAIAILTVLVIVAIFQLFQLLQLRGYAQAMLQVQKVQAANTTAPAVTVPTTSARPSNSGLANQVGGC